ncbi:hypothetical protein [Roseiconus lacunae]|uniref:Uncharacterized protein n=1 Tax=Roseiconus lacunae TaxID=2605694 RepID=A0ABT7PSK1_9BACT|nr:hypothetical protein [Roseiconus lacunae]MDM4019328.1 hypothetical protein [Roseiconus lacunae]
MSERLLTVLVSLVLVLSGTHVQGEENPVLNKLLAKKIKEELSKFHSPETGYRDGAHWLHFDDPGRSLNVSVNVKKEKRIELAGTITAKIAFNYQVELSKTFLGERVVFARHDFGGHADATLSVTASALPAAKLSDTKVQIKEIRVNNLRMRSDLADRFRGRIESFVNDVLRNKKGDFETKLADALNKVKLAPIVSATGNQQKDAFEAAVADIVKKALLDLTKGKQFSIRSNDPGFKGTIVVVDPATNTKIDIREFKVQSDTATVDAVFETRLRIKGTLTLEGETIPLHVVADTTVNGAGQSRLDTDGDGFVIKSHVSSADAKVTVKELLEPDDLQGGDEFASQLLTKLLSSRKADILKALNKQIEVQPLEL